MKLMHQPSMMTPARLLGMPSFLVLPSTTLVCTYGSMLQRLALTALLLGASSAGALTGNVSAGKQAFAPCASCHQVGPEARSGFGPQLNHIFGRRAGSAPDYKYSKAMKNVQIVWQEQELAAFIKDPDRTVPGTRMRFYSLGYDDQKIADLLAYLRTFDAPH